MSQKRNIEAIYALSPMQQGMLFHTLYEPESGVYFEQFHCTLHGDLDTAVFTKAWQHIINRHTILRTSFAWEQIDKMLQIVHKQVPIKIEQLDWRDLSPNAQKTAWETYLNTEREKGFDLSKAPLMRLGLIQIADKTHRFIWHHHHLLLDGWSVPIVFTELMTLYTAYSQGQDIQLEPAQPYKRYIDWIKKQDETAASHYWQQKLAGFTAPTPLIVDQTIPNPSIPYQEIEVRLPEETTAALQAIANTKELTLNTLLQGVWALLLHRYSGEDDVVFGSTVSGRPAKLFGVEQIVGLFINTLPVRVTTTPKTPVLTWLHELQDQLVDMRQYEFSALSQIQTWSDVPQELPLFESIVVFENYPMDETLRVGQGVFKITDVGGFEKTNYPLTVVSGPGTELPIRIAYDGHKFDESTIRRMLGHICTLLQGIADDPSQPISSLPMLTDAERQQILVEWNDTAVSLDNQLLIPQQIEAIAEQYPENTAVYYEGHTLTYAELNQKANQIAHYLLTQGIEPEDIVGIHMPRSCERLTATLGVLKAGAAYLPISPNYPPERISFMIEDAQPKVILTEKGVSSQLSAISELNSQQSTDNSQQTTSDHSQFTIHNSLFIILNSVWDNIAILPTTTPPLSHSPTSLAYIIYTSGSTGKPKGTLLHHRGLRNVCHAYSQNLEIKPNSRFLRFFSFSFDGSAADIFPALSGGAALYIPPRDMLMSPEALHAYIQTHAITHIGFTPTMLNLLPEHNLPHVSHIYVGGEPCKPALVHRWQTGRSFMNAYGPTETSIVSITNIFSDERPLPQTAVSTPIGRPLPNTQLAILDKQGHPTPIGVPGELHIGGDGVAHGYLNRPELTAERFVSLSGIGNQLSVKSKPITDHRSPTTVYRTGDLCRWLPDGTVDFLGRADNQVKIRGFRIELGEIEAVLQQHQAVQETAVLAHEDPRLGTQLIAYVQAIPNASPTENALHDFLKNHLPIYMVPAVFVMMDKLPRLPNTKLNRKALPKPDLTDRHLTDYTPPRTATEEIIAGIWSDVLGVDRISIHDNFHQLGGHSLLGTQIMSRLRRAFKIDIPLRTLFEQPTIAELAATVQTMQTDSTEPDLPLTAVSPDNIPPLSFAQQRLWFLDQLEPGNLFYNLTSAIRLTGNLNGDALQHSINELVSRHESLRTLFVTKDGVPHLHVLPELTLPLTLDDFTALPAAEQEIEARALIDAEARRPFNLATGPLLRMRLIQLAPQAYIAVIAMHHIISDGWSMGVFIQELTALYEAFSSSQPSPLPEPAIQYADYAHWQQQWLAGDRLSQQLDYWKQQLHHQPLLIDLPTDHPRPAVQTSNGASATFTLTSKLTQKLKAISRAEGVTLFMTLLAAYNILLSRYARQEDISVGTAVANRNRPEIEGLIGFFVNTLVMRTDLSGQPSFKKLLHRVREVALGAYAHQDVPFEMLVDTLQPDRNMSHTPLFQVAFSWQNMPLQPIELPGITWEPLSADNDTSQFDMLLEMGENDNGTLHGHIKYNIDLYHPERIQRMIDHFETLLHAIADDPKRPITELPLLTPAEQQLMLVDWNATNIPYPDNTTIHALIEQHAVERPEVTAVSLNTTTLSYAELNGRANQLAHHLIETGVTSGDIIGIATHRTPEMIVGILATLKAGAAYLPLDPSYPPERLAFMIEDAQPKAILSQEAVSNQLSAISRENSQQSTDNNQRTTTPHSPLTINNQQLIILSPDWQEFSHYPTTNPTITQSPTSLAYLIYTSGSTGKPKGTLLAHQGLCNLTDVQRRNFNIRAGESRILQFSPLSFDASVWETFMALRNGATLVLADQETLASGHELVRLLERERITTVTLPPSLLAVMPDAELLHLETIIAAGEACSLELVQRWGGNGRSFFNAYGPTETTVCASMFHTHPDDTLPPPIGKPNDNFQLFIADAHLNPVPIGVPGELLIGGVGLAKGYLNRPDLTAERFVSLAVIGNQVSGISEPTTDHRSPTTDHQPPTTDYRSPTTDHQPPTTDYRSPTTDHRPPTTDHRPPTTVYRTGDLCRFRPDGNVEFLGRIDHQVKVRGFRIELGEIEAVLRTHHDLQDVIVIADGDSPDTLRLIAYVVPTEQPGPTEPDLRDHLRRTLPEYMVPSIFVMLAEMPLTPSNKIDRKALPDPDQSRSDQQQTYVAPRNEVEKKLTTICADLLQVQQVGVFDNFFQIGGHSLLATQFISRIYDEFRVELPLRSLFENPTIAAVAQRLQASETSNGKLTQVEDLMALLDGLSDEEAAALLAEKLQAS